METWADKIKGSLAKKSKVKGVRSCMIWRGYSRNNYGYFNTKVPGSNKRTMIHVHRVAYMAYTENVHLPKGCDVSHLCHRSLCVCFEHLSVEPRRINNSRKTCRKNRTCAGHGDYPDCLVWTTMSCKFLSSILLNCTFTNRPLSWCSHLDFLPFKSM